MVVVYSFSSSVSTEVCMVRIFSLVLSASSLLSAINSTRRSKGFRITHAPGVHTPHRPQCIRKSKRTRSLRRHLHTESSGSCFLLYTFSEGVNYQLGVFLN